MSDTGNTDRKRSERVVCGVTITIKTRGESGQELLDRVVAGERVIWKFTYEDYPKGITVELHEQDGVLYALTVDKNRRQLLDVYPIGEMERWQPLGKRDGKLMFSGRKITETVEHLHAFAEKLKLTLCLSKTEQQVHAQLLVRLKAEADKRREEIYARLRQEHGEAEAKRADEERKRERIVRRKRLHGFGANGLPLRGIPVAGEDWHKLPHGTHCVGVKSYDDETDKSGEITGDYFEVEKTSGGRLSLVNVKNFSLTAAPIGAELIDTMLIEDGMKEVGIFKDTRSLDCLKRKGLNGGELVGIPVGGDTKVIQLYRFSHQIYTLHGEPIRRNV